MNLTPSHQEIDMDSYDAYCLEPAEPDRELCERTADGVQVRLIWRPTSESLAVLVDDSRSGESFEIPVVGDVDPMDVFEHPYYHAGSLTIADLLAD
jgi:hypothetical protein